MRNCLTYNTHNSDKILISHDIVWPWFCCRVWVHVSSLIFSFFFIRFHSKLLKSDYIRWIFMYLTDILLCVSLEIWLLKKKNGNQCQNGLSTGNNCSWVHCAFMHIVHRCTIEMNTFIASDTLIAHLTQKKVTDGNVFWRDKNRNFFHSKIYCNPFKL